MDIPIEVQKDRIRIVWATLRTPKVEFMVFHPELYH